MKRKLRSKEINVRQEYQKRKMTNDTVSHFILYPVAFPAIGKKNEFFIHALSLCWNDKNTLKDSRCQQMYRGLHLQHPIDTESLLKSTNGWFTSCRHNDLEKIGKVSGYFIRLFSRSVASVLDEKFDTQSRPIDDDKFADFVCSLKREKIVVPAIIKLQLSVESAFDASQFIQLNEKDATDLSNGDELIVTPRCSILKVADELHEWGWHMLDMINYEDRQNVLSKGIPRVGSSYQEIESSVPIPLIETNEMEHGGIHSEIPLRSSTRLKCPNKTYRKEMYEL